MKKNWPGNKGNEIGEEIQVEVREPTERISRSQSMKLENNIVILRKVEDIRKGNMEEEALFPEEEEEPEEVKLDVIPMENQGTSIRNVPREINKEEAKHTSLKHRSMWKQKQ
jgi:hypothetical protein